jgi:hypothetical protein
MELRSSETGVPADESRSAQILGVAGLPGIGRVLCLN